MTKKYVNPAICAHRRVVSQWPRSGQVWIKCEICNLYGPPVTVGWFKWWAESKAARGFYKLANQLDKSAGLALVLILCSCSALVTDNHESQDFPLDAADDDQSDSSESSDSVDTLDTSDTDTDTDTDTDGCPWQCKPRLPGETAPFACSDPWGEGEPPAVVNRFFNCPNFGYCCQPWPPPDHPDALTDRCVDGWTCDSLCESAWLGDQVCFDATHKCCKVLE